MLENSSSRKITGKVSSTVGSGTSFRTRARASLEFGVMDSPLELSLWRDITVKTCPEDHTYKNEPLGRP